jgi:hypothetical protein
VLNFPILLFLLRSTYTGEVLQIDVRRSATVSFLLKQAITAAGVKSDADVGGHAPLRIHWMLVQSSISEWWLLFGGQHNPAGMAEVVIETSPGKFRSYSGLRHTLESIGVADGVTFELYGFPITFVAYAAAT